MLHVLNSHKGVTIFYGGGRHLNKWRRKMPQPNNLILGTVCMYVLYSVYNYIINYTTLENYFGTFNNGFKGKK